MSAEIATQEVVDPIATAVALLDGRSVAEAKQLAGDIIRALNERVMALGKEHKVAEELNALLVLMGSALGNCTEDMRNPDGSVDAGSAQTPMLREAAQMAVRLGKPDYNSSTLWRGIAQTLRAEALLLLGDHPAAHAAALSAAATLELLQANHLVDACQAYVKNLLAGNTPPLTTHTFIHQLHATLHSEP